MLKFHLASIILTGLSCNSIGATITVHEKQILDETLKKKAKILSHVSTAFSAKSLSPGIVRTLDNENFCGQVCFSEYDFSSTEPSAYDLFCEEQAPRSCLEEDPECGCADVDVLQAACSSGAEAFSYSYFSLSYGVISDECFQEITGLCRDPCYSDCFSEATDNFDLCGNPDCYASCNSCFHGEHHARSFLSLSE